MKPRQVLATIGVVVLWCAVTAASMHRLMTYAYTPSATLTAAADWPISLSGTRPSARPVLVMFVHPECPCSRASVAELAELLPKLRDRIDVRVFVERIDGVVAERSAPWAAAAAIPGVQVTADPGGGIAKSFHAAVSGETMLYGTDGRLLFRGGLTPSRGHQGDSDGRRAVMALAAGSVDVPRQTPVFGCYLRGSES